MKKLLLITLSVFLMGGFVQATDDGDQGEAASSVESSDSDTESSSTIGVDDEAASEPATEESSDQSMEVLGEDE